MLARIALAIAALLSTQTLRKLVDTVFVRTRKQLDAACADPVAAQAARLRAVLEKNARTEVGRRLGFAAIAANASAAALFEAYRAGVPLCRWDDVEPLVARMVAGEKNLIVNEDPYFYATTSGTTGRRKLIPVTSSFVEECRVANKLLYRATLLTMPELLHGKRLAMRSPKTEKVNERGALAGSITVALGGGFEEDEGAFDAVPADVFFVNDFAARYFLAVRFALQERVAVCSAVNPSTLLLFARTLAERGEELARALDDGALGLDDASLASAGVDDARAGRLRARALKDPAAAARIRASATEHGAARMCDVLPALAGLVCWKGGSAPFYLDQLVHSYGPVPVLDYGYCASEGCFGAALSTDGAASVLLPHGHVIELIAEDDVDEVRAGKKPTVLLHEAQVGARYFVVVTTGAGLYRYEMNDVIEIVGKRDQAPLAIFRHKGGAMSSITGEKIGESHVVSAMASAAKTTGARVAGFAVAPLLPLPSSSSSSSAAAAVLAAAEPRYVLAIDAPALADAALAALARAFDEALAIENEEYDAKRKSLRLDAVIAARLPADSIATHRKKRVDGGAPDAHVKIPHVSPDGALLIELGFALSAPDLAAQLPCARAPPPKSA